MYYITKGALTQGITVVDENRDDITKLTICNNTLHFDFNGVAFFSNDGDWFRTKEDAIERVYAMKQERLASLEKQIEELLSIDQPVFLPF